MLLFTFVEWFTVGKCNFDKTVVVSFEGCLESSFSVVITHAESIDLNYYIWEVHINILITN